MTTEEQTLFTIKGIISELPADQKEACLELAELIRQNVKNAGELVGTIALTLIVAEMQKANT